MDLVFFQMFQTDNEFTQFAHFTSNPLNIPKCHITVNSIGKSSKFKALTIQHHTYPQIPPHKQQSNHPMESTSLIIIHFTSHFVLYRTSLLIDCDGELEVEGSETSGKTATLYLFQLLSNTMQIYEEQYLVSACLYWSYKAL